MHQVRMVAGEHLRVEPAILGLQLLEGDEEPFFEFDHAFVEVCNLHLHLVLQDPLLVGG